MILQVIKDPTLWGEDNKVIRELRISRKVFRPLFALPRQIGAKSFVYHKLSAAATSQSRFIAKIVKLGRKSLRSAILNKNSAFSIFQPLHFTVTNIASKQSIASVVDERDGQNDRFKNQLHYCLRSCSNLWDNSLALVQLFSNSTDTSLSRALD